MDPGEIPVLASKLSYKVFTLFLSIGLGQFKEGWYATTNIKFFNSNLPAFVPL